MTNVRKYILHRMKYSALYRERLYSFTILFYSHWTQKTKSRPEAIVVSGVKVKIHNRYRILILVSGSIKCKGKYCKEVMDSVPFGKPIFF